MTYQTIYFSASSTPMQVDELEDILEQAQSNNSRNGITGALVYIDGSFLQILEGENDKVQALMQKISNDFRHETVSVLHEGEIEAAAFCEWKMAYVSATAEQIARWAGLSSTTQLPEVWQGIRQDPSRATQLTNSILGVPFGGTSS